MSEIILITGGCRSGKSAFAVKLARALTLPTAFIATCVPGSDEEMWARVAAHRANRPPDWRLVEEGYDLESTLATVLEPVLLLDCVPTLIGNLLLSGDADAVIASAVAKLGQSLCRCAARFALVVTAEVGDGLVPDSALGRRFRDLVGAANQFLAAEASSVYDLVDGLAIECKSRAETPVSIAARLNSLIGTHP